MNSISIEFPSSRATREMPPTSADVRGMLTAIWDEHLASTISGHELLKEFAEQFRSDWSAYDSLGDADSPRALKVRRDYRFGVLSVLSPLDAAYASSAPLDCLRRSSGYFTEAASELAFVADRFEELMAERQAVCPLVATGVAIEPRFSPRHPT